MQIPIYHINAFAEKIFTGNPAAVCVLSDWLNEKLLQNIAAENQLPATAFLVRKEKEFDTRWFSPEYEIDLCGHGSLSSAFVIFNILSVPSNEVILHYHNGQLRLKKTDDFFTLEFPAKNIESVNDLTLIEGLGHKPTEIYQHKNERCLAVFDSEGDILNIKPNMNILKKLPYRGVIVTAPGKNYDFVSRTFYPKKAACEDAVTGSSHCLLIPYWSKKLNKTKLTAYQASQRGGMLACENLNDKVLISGKAVLYMKGIISL